MKNLDALVALIIMAIFTVTIMLAMRKVSREYMTKEPRTFTEMEEDRNELQ